MQMVMIKANTHFDSQSTQNVSQEVDKVQDVWICSTLKQIEQIGFIFLLICVAAGK